MPQLRRDPISGRWVIISTERAKRPTEYKHEEQKTNDTSNCPFCPGREKMTPPEIMAFREKGSKPDEPGWRVRVVPNKFPALKIEGPLDKAADGIYDKMNGVGAHEVIIETPDHLKETHDLNEKEMTEVLLMYRARMLDLKRDPRFKFVLVFKNRGRAAGASLTHPHSQLIALPVVPKRVREEIQGGEQYYEFRERCVYCDMIDQETYVRVRVVGENDLFLAIEPFASRFPFETWIMPKVHSSSFNLISDQEIPVLAQLMKSVLARLNKALNNPSYNYVLHTAPFSQPDIPHYHWHFEIMPKLTQLAGFEFGSGFYINPTPPEEAAKYLQEA